MADGPANDAIYRRPVLESENDGAGEPAAAAAEAEAATADAVDGDADELADEPVADAGHDE